MSHDRKPTTWTSVVTVGIFAVATVLGIDRALCRKYGAEILSQAEDGLRVLRATDPIAVVLGSSQARSFETMDQMLAAETGGAVRAPTISIEDGKLSSAAWLFEHRVLPLVRERDASGARVRKHLRHLILITDWWDSMAPTDGRLREGRWESRNLPARCWSLADFLDDARATGLTEFNRLFLSAAWSGIWGDSPLVRDRGYMLLRRLLRHGKIEFSIEQNAVYLESVRKMVEESAQRILADQEMVALGRICELARDEGLTCTVVLFPALVETISAVGRKETLDRFAAVAAPLVRARGATFHDWSFNTPLETRHFRDQAHLNAAGHLLLSTWALEGDLAFLSQGRPESRREPR